MFDMNGNLIRLKHVWEMCVCFLSMKLSWYTLDGLKQATLFKYSPFTLKGEKTTFEY